MHCKDANLFPSDKPFKQKNNRFKANRLWFAWKIVLLQYRKQLTIRAGKNVTCCDLLEKSYFCSIANNPPCLAWPVRVVVICLKNRTFAVSQTSGQREQHLEQTLWFAWKIVLLQYHKHLPITGFLEPRCCDLLEKSYFCSITNIKFDIEDEDKEVVICLKNRTFAVSQTSVVLIIKASLSLWFAWKIVLLQYHKHRLQLDCNNTISCDLLEKSYFCSITNIGQARQAMRHHVVICLKNRTFAVSQTSLFLLDFEQVRCDLLEKSYFCSITNIQFAWQIVPILLWFAWKIVLLQYHKHLNRGQFGIVTVVICLKNRTFAVSQTSDS